MESTKGLELPAGLPEKTRAMLEKVVARGCRISPQLLELRDAYQGGEVAKSEKYFKRPPKLNSETWQVYREMIVYYNLTKPAVGRWVSALFDNVFSIRVEGGLYKSEMDALLYNPRRQFKKLCRHWARRAIHYGKAAVIPVIKDILDHDTGNIVKKVVRYWEPIPFLTELIPDPSDVYEIVGLVEWLDVQGNGFRFITAEGDGIVYPGNSGMASEFSPQDWGFFPGAVAFGEDSRPEGSCDGHSLVADHPAFARAVSQKKLRESIINALQSRGLLYVIGQLEQGSSLSNALTPDGYAHLKAQGQIGYATPNVNFEAMRQIVRGDISLLATISRQPLDVLDASLIGDNQSAEGARLRNLSFAGATNELAEDFTGYFGDLALKTMAMVEYSKKESPVDLLALEETAQISVRLKPAVVPESRVEAANTDIALNKCGALSDSDFAEKWNDDKSPDEIQAIAENIAAAKQQAREFTVQGKRYGDKSTAPAEGGKPIETEPPAAKGEIEPGNNGKRPPATPGE
jgi:hypothetical protein